MSVRILVCLWRPHYHRSREQKLALQKTCWSAAASTLTSAHICFSPSLLPGFKMSLLCLESSGLWCYQLRRVQIRAEVPNSCCCVTSTETMDLWKIRDGHQSFSHERHIMTALPRAVENNPLLCYMEWYAFLTFPAEARKTRMWNLTSSTKVLINAQMALM